ncbi:MAG: helix-turn-helix domain-containing protein [Planctomycetes bacterium]|nr:helix-turn-helix domain-containing protein [Planctomycetota bacterium]
MATSTEVLRRRFFARLSDAGAIAALYDHLPTVFFYIKDDAGRFMHMNRALRRMLGVTQDRQIIGRTDYDLFRPELADQYVAEDREVAKARRTIADRVWLVPDASGVVRWFMSTKTPLVDRSGKAIGIAGVMQDIAGSGSVLGPYQQFAGVIAHVSEHFASTIHIADLAALAHLSVSQFVRRFKAQFGFTPARYVRQVRINAACRLLSETPMGLEHIAQRTGFFDASHFVKLFRKHLGQTPEAYRRRFAGRKKDRRRAHGLS